MMSNSTQDSLSDNLANGLPLETFTNWLQEIENQPAWRSAADRQMEYVDGNQLDAEVLQKQKALGMPPAIEPLIGPVIEDVLGYEAKNRTDWRVTPDAEDAGGDDVAKALNYRINQAERHSGADAAMGEAFKPQYCVGLGWVEVAKESDPFKYGKRCQAVHRNEIYWDWLSVKYDLSDARYLVRRRWTDFDQVALKFPKHRDLLSRVMGRWSDVDVTTDGGTSTSLSMAWDQERGWSIEEMQWRDSTRSRVCLFEVWYRRWERVIVMRSPDGRVVEVDKKNPVHLEALASGLVQAEEAVVARMRVSYWAGPHKLHDGPSPYPHTHFPYVPFWGNREDRTMIPYGVVRGMVYLQDNVNSAISKIRWGLSSTRTTRTKGAVAYSDAVFRQQIGRVDADIVLDADHMSQPGAVFKVERDFQLNEQQYKMLVDARNGIKRAGGLGAAFEGQPGSATSGVQEGIQVEQTTQSLADMMDNFRRSRTMVGELLLAMEIAEIGDKPTRVRIPGNAVVKERVVMLNEPAVDEETGIAYRNNDVLRTRLKCSLQEVPSTPSFRQQQLKSLAEAFKSMPQETQLVALPHLLNLMDVPNKDEIIQAIQASKNTQTPEQIQELIDRAVTDAGLKLKERELELKYSPEKLRAEIDLMMAEAVQKGVQSAFAAMQAGQVIASMPQIAPVADAVMAGAGYRTPNPMGDDPNFPVPGVPDAIPNLAQPMAVPPPDVRQNTSPNFPPVPDDGVTAMDGIETPRMTDNAVE